MTGLELTVGGWFASGIITKVVNTAMENLKAGNASKKAANDLVNMLPVLQLLIAEARTGPIENRALRNWLVQLKDALYDAEDVMDAIEVKNIRQTLYPKGMVSDASSSVFKGVKKLVLGDGDVYEFQSKIEKLKTISENANTYLNILTKEREEGKEHELLRKEHEKDSRSPDLPAPLANFVHEKEKKLIFDAILNSTMSSINTNKNDNEHERHERRETEHRGQAIGENVIDNILSGKGKGEIVRTEFIGDTSSKSQDKNPLVSTDDLGQPLESSAEQKKAKHDYSRNLVIPIVGYSGVGKTSLAKTAYNDQELQKQFELILWLYVSNSDFSNHFNGIIYNDKSSEKKGVIIDPDSHDKLNKLIHGKRFLFVLDNVIWSTKLPPFWDAILGLCTIGNQGSVVLVTTPQMSVATYIETRKIQHQTITTPIKLDPLETKPLLRLLEYFVFGKPNFPEDKISLKPIFNEIARKLHGLPLAAKLMGDLLRLEVDASRWQNIRKSKFWEDENGKSNIFPFLVISYQYLETSQKECFAFCSVFPRNCLIEKDKLVKMWIANNLICPVDSVDDYISLELEGEKIFDELVKRSFIDPTPWDNKYIMHDLMRELALSASCHECFVYDDDDESPCPFGCVLDANTHPCKHGFSITYSSRSFSIPRLTRHMSLKICKYESKMESCSNAKLRTLLFFGGFRNEIHRISQQSNYLRVFKLASDIRSSQLITDIVSKLRCLRYLELSFTNLTDLPELICTLYHLQVLDLGVKDFRQLPKGINNLFNLRYLHASTNTISLISGIGKLTKLRELEEFRIKREEGHGINELSKMTDIGGHLCIRNLENVATPEVANQANLREKQHLKILTLSWEEQKFVESNVKDQKFAKSNVKEILEQLKPHRELEELKIENYCGPALPTWIMQKYLRDLKSVYLSCCLNLTNLPPFGQLPYLKSLFLSRLDKIEHVGDEFYGGGDCDGIFPLLEDLSFCDMLNWKIWEGKQEKLFFPHLKKLSIKNCIQLENAPLSLQKEENDPLCSLNQSIKKEELLDGTIKEVELHGQTIKEVELSDCPKLIMKVQGDIQKLYTRVSSLKINYGGGSIDLLCDHLDNLKSLYFQGCNVNFCTNMGSLVNLTKLDLHSTRFLGIHSDCQLQHVVFPNLTHIRVTNVNCIRDLVYIAEFPSLRKLNIEGSSYIALLDEWFEQLDSLQNIVIGGNLQLLVINANLKKFSSLETLTIRAVKEVVLNDGTFMPPKLKELIIDSWEHEKFSIIDSWNEKFSINGEYWPKICHVPYIRVNRRTLQNQKEGFSA